MVAQPVGVDEQHAAEALIAEAGTLMRGADPDIPEDFVTALFANAVPEDLMHYDAGGLAALAADAWSPDGRSFVYGANLFVDGGVSAMDLS